MIGIKMESILMDSQLQSAQKFQQFDARVQASLIDVIENHSLPLCIWCWFEDCSDIFLLSPGPMRQHPHRFTVLHFLIFTKICFR